MVVRGKPADCRPIMVGDNGGSGRRSSRISESNISSTGVKSPFPRDFHRISCSGASPISGRTRSESEISRFRPINRWRPSVFVPLVADSLRRNGPTATRSLAPGCLPDRYGFSLRFGLCPEFPRPTVPAGGQSPYRENRHGGSTLPGSVRGDELLENGHSRRLKRQSSWRDPKDCRRRSSRVRWSGDPVGRTGRSDRGIETIARSSARWHRQTHSVGIR